MSLDTWKQEFMPTPAHDVAENDALDWCIRKYTGFRREALRRHGIEWIGWTWILRDDPEQILIMPVGHRNCALCVHFFVGTDGAQCQECPIVTVGEKPCFEDDQPYTLLLDTGDPESLIQVLRKAKAAATDGKETLT